MADCAYCKRSGASHLERKGARYQWVHNRCLERPQRQSQYLLLDPHQRGWLEQFLERLFHGNSQGKRSLRAPL